MGIFGWSLPPGCGPLPGEEDCAYEVSFDGNEYAWDDSDNVYVYDPTNEAAGDDGYVFLTKVEWPDDPDADPRTVLRQHIKEMK